MNFEKVKKSLEYNGYDVTILENSEEVIAYLDKKLDNRKIGIGGSVTIRDMGLYDRLVKHNTIKWHWAESALDEVAKTDVYILSANAIAETGEIINIDGSGNRVASSIFGHREVIYIVGKNKIAEDFDKAMWRARNIAAPKNAQRLNCKTPCAEKADKCYNCNSPDRICRALTVIWKKPSKIDHGEIILVNEDLGF